MGKLYGIGVGPGDPELLTLKTRRILNAMGVIFYPEKETGAGSFTFGIVQGPLEDTKAEIVNLAYPMHHHGTQLREMRKQNTGCTAQCLNGDRTGAFITLGDPAVYNTFTYTFPYIEKAGVEVEAVPGVTSFYVVADFMKMPPVTWNEDLVIAPVHRNSSEDLGRVLGEHDNVAPIRPSIDPQALLKALKENHPEDRFALIIKTGIGEERLVTDLGELERYDIPYLSTVTTKKQGGQ